MTAISENILKLKNYDVKVCDFPGKFDVLSQLQWDVELESIEEMEYLIKHIRRCVIRRNPDLIYFDLEDLMKALRLLDFLEDLTDELEKVKEKKQNAEPQKI